MLLSAIRLSSYDQSPGLLFHCLASNHAAQILHTDAGRNSYVEWPQHVPSAIVKTTRRCACTDTTCGSHMLMVASGSLLCLRLRQGVSSLSLSLHNPLDHAAPSISSSIGLPITGPVYSVSDLARWWNENRIETSRKSLCCPALDRAA